ALASAVARLAERPQGWDDPNSPASQNYMAAFQRVVGGDVALTPRERGAESIAQAARSTLAQQRAEEAPPPEEQRLPSGGLLADVGRQFQERLSGLLSEAAQTATAFLPPIGVSEEEAQRRTARLGEVTETLREALPFTDPGHVATAALERAGVPGHEEIGFQAGPFEIGPREVLGFAAGLAVPGGGAGQAGRAAQRLAREAQEVVHQR